MATKARGGGKSGKGTGAATIAFGKAMKGHVNYDVYANEIHYDRAKALSGLRKFRYSAGGGLKFFPGRVTTIPKRLKEGDKQNKTQTKIEK